MHTLVRRDCTKSAIPHKRIKTVTDASFDERFVLLDLFTASPYRDFAFFRNDGSVTSPNFVESSTNVFQHLQGTWFDTKSHTMKATAVDLDDDGDTDVISALSMGDRVTWYENAGN